MSRTPFKFLKILLLTFFLIIFPIYPIEDQGLSTNCWPHINFSADRSQLVKSPLPIEDQGMPTDSWPYINFSADRGQLIKSPLPIEDQGMPTDCWPHINFSADRGQLIKSPLPTEDQGMPTDCWPHINFSADRGQLIKSPLPIEDQGVPTDCWPHINFSAVRGLLVIPLGRNFHCKLVYTQTLHDAALKLVNNSSLAKNRTKTASCSINSKQYILNHGAWTTLFLLKYSRFIALTIHKAIVQIIKFSLNQKC